MRQVMSAVVCLGVLVAVASAAGRHVGERDKIVAGVSYGAQAGLTTTDGIITIGGVTPTATSTPVTPTATSAPVTPTATPVPPTATATEIPKSVGDVNCSGGLPTIVDAQLIAQVVLGRIAEGDLDCPDNADVNGNGEVDIADAQLIAQLVSARITVWPPG